MNQELGQDIRKAINQLKDELKNKGLEWAKNGGEVSQWYDQIKTDREIKKIYDHCKTLTRTLSAERSQEDEKAAGLSEGEWALIEALDLGPEGQEAFKAVFLKEVYGFSAEKLALVVKTREAFEWLNANPKQKVEPQLWRAMMEMLGLEARGDQGDIMLREVSKAIKAEQLGDLLCYALSGKFQDIKESIKELPWGEQVERLIGHLNHQRCLIKAQWAIPNEAMRVTIERAKDGSWMDKEETQGAYWADHAMVNIKEKKIIVGFSTSQQGNHRESQAMAPLRTYTSLKELVKKERVNGAENPWKGFEVESFHLYNGMYCLEKDLSKDQKGGMFLASLAACGLGEQEAKSFNEMAIIFGNVTQMNLIEGWSASLQYQELLNSNAFVTGMDTIDWYAMKEQWGMLSHEDARRAKELFLIRKVTQCIESWVHFKEKGVQNEGFKMIESKIVKSLKQGVEFIEQSTDPKLRGEPAMKRLLEGLSAWQREAEESNSDLAGWLELKGLGLERGVSDGGLRRYEKSQKNPIQEVEFKGIHPDHLERRGVKVDDAIAWCVQKSNQEGRIRKMIESVGSDLKVKQKSAVLMTLELLDLALMTDLSLEERARRVKEVFWRFPEMKIGDLNRLKRNAAKLNHETMPWFEGLIKEVDLPLDLWVNHAFGVSKRKEYSINTKKMEEELKHWIERNDDWGVASWMENQGSGQELKKNKKKADSRAQ